MQNYLDFEKPLAEIEGKAEELRAMGRANSEMNVEKEAAALDKKADQLLKDLYKDLTPWRKCQVARHPNRPHCRDYIDQLFTEYTPLAGDRNFADDHAVMGGLARLDGRPVMVIGQEKGHDTQSRIERNFGMARPEGYRKAIRLMDLADRFNVPVITLVDTAFATANRVAMLEHSVYSVISPEGCASILWKDAEKMREAAEQLRLTAQDLHKLGVIDRIIAEPAGGAQRDPKAAIKSVGACLEDMIDKLSGLSRQDIVRERRKKFLNMGSKGLAA